MREDSLTLEVWMRPLASSEGSLSPCGCHRAVWQRPARRAYLCWEKGAERQGRPLPTLGSFPAGLGCLSTARLD